MRYLLEKDYKTDIDFCNEITVKEGNLSSTFEFANMQKWRNMERDEFTNGVLRSTYKTIIHEVEKKTFSANIWRSKIAVVSNIGILIFNKANQKERPELIDFGDTFAM